MNHYDLAEIQEAIVAAGKAVGSGVFDGLDNVFGPCKAGFSLACRVGDGLDAIASAIDQMTEQVERVADSADELVELLKRRE